MKITEAVNASSGGATDGDEVPAPHPERCLDDGFAVGLMNR